jgi:nondiscriminating aspartyl-tRNA synthetase
MAPPQTVVPANTILRGWHGHIGASRVFIENICEFVSSEVRLKGWIYRLRILGKTAFVILRDCTGEAQCVIASDTLKDYRLKVEDVVEIHGSVRVEPRSKTGHEVDISEIRVLNRAGQHLPFQSASDVESVGLDTLINYRPLALRTETVGDIFRVQAALLAFFRDALNRRRFTEIITSKIVGGGTEGGTNLFEIKYFDRVPHGMASVHAERALLGVRCLSGNVANGFWPH